MRTVYILIIVLLSMNDTVAQNKFKFYKDHDALQVRDLEKSARFYSEVFGFEEIDNAGLGSNFRWFQLNDKVQLHLIGTKEEITKHKGVHLAISTDNLSGFMEFLKTKAIPFENWPGIPNTSNTRPDGIKQIYISDPDGYWIEVNDNSLK